MQSNQVVSKLGTTRLVTVGFGTTYAIFSDTPTLLLQFDEFCFGSVEFETKQAMQEAIKVRLFLRLCSYVIDREDLIIMSDCDIGISDFD